MKPLASVSGSVIGIAASTAVILLAQSRSS
jgi:hypothetical protein